MDELLEAILKEIFFLGYELGQLNPDGNGEFEWSVVLDKMPERAPHMMQASMAWNQ